MSTEQPTSVVVHHHHYAAPVHTGRLARRPLQHPPARRGTSPALLLAAGAGITVALVVAVTVATALAVLIGLVAVVVLVARSYAQLERDARTGAPALPRRDARGRFTA